MCQGVKREPLGSSMASMGRKGSLREAGGGQLGHKGTRVGSSHRLWGVTDRLWGADRHWTEAALQDSWQWGVGGEWGKWQWFGRVKKGLMWGHEEGAQGTKCVKHLIVEEPGGVDSTWASLWDPRRPGQEPPNPWLSLGKCKTLIV